MNYSKFLLMVAFLASVGLLMIHKVDYIGALVVLAVIILFCIGFAFDNDK